MGDCHDASGNAAAVFVTKVAQQCSPARASLCTVFQQSKDDFRLDRYTFTKRHSADAVSADILRACSGPRISADQRYCISDIKSHEAYL
jgi:hypothetical protein